MRRVIALMLFSLLALAGMASAQSTCSIALSTSGFATFIGLAAIGIAISFLLIAVSYMAGEVLNYNALKGWYRTELWEVSKSIIIIAVVFFSIVIASAVADMLVGSSSSLQAGSPASTFSSLSTNLQGLCNGATGYLAGSLNQAYIDFASMLGVSQGIGALKSITFATWVPLPIPPFPTPVLSLQFGSIANIYVSSYIETLTPTTVFSFIKDMFTIILFPMLLAFQFQYDFISVVMVLGLGGLLPVGVILRAMPFTRGIGGTFIALGIGAALVYPILLVGFNQPISNYISGVIPQQPLTSSAATSSEPLFGPLINSLTSLRSSISSLFVLRWLVGTPSVNGYPNIVNDMNSGFINGESAGFWDPLEGNIITILSTVIDQTIYLLMQFFLFIFDLVIGLAVVNQIAKMLGGTLSISQMGVGKMKLS